MNAKKREIAAPLILVMILSFCCLASATLCDETADSPAGTLDYVAVSDIVTACDLTDILYLNSDLYDDSDIKTLRSICTSLDLAGTYKLNTDLGDTSRESALIVNLLVRTADWNSFGLTYDKRIFAGTCVQI